MERHEILELMGELALVGMRHSCDEVMADGLKRQHAPPVIVGNLLRAEIAEKQARSIKYQMTMARMPLAKELADFAFADAPVNEGLVRDLANGGFLAHQRNVVLVGGTGTGKTHLAIAIARACIRGGARARFFNTTDLVNRLEAESRQGRAGKLSEQLARLDLVVLDELATCPLRNRAGNCSSTSSPSSTKPPPSSSPPTWPSASGPPCSATPR